MVSTAPVTGQVVSNDNRPSAANSSVSPAQQEQISTPPHSEKEVASQETQTGIGDSPVGPTQPEQISTPPHSEKKVASQETHTGFGDSPVSPAQPEQISSPQHSDSELNITVITSEEDTSTDAVVADTSSSKSTLMSNLSSSKMDEEIATGMVDPHTTVIEPINDPPPETQPETPRCKFTFFLL